MTNNEHIEVRSLTLLKMINDSKLMKFLCFVRTEEVEGTFYPVYCFYNDKDIADCINSFAVKYGTTDREADDQTLWAGFDGKMLKDYSSCKKINSRKYQVVNRAFKAGHMSSLIGVFRDERGRKTFRFTYNDEIANIKAEEDERSRIEWESKQGGEGKSL